MNTLQARWDVDKSRWELIDDTEKWDINNPRAVGGIVQNISKMPGFPPMVQIFRCGDTRPDVVTFYIANEKLGDARVGDSVWALVIQDERSKSPVLMCVDFNSLGRILK